MKILRPQQRWQANQTPGQLTGNAIHIVQLDLSHPLVSFAAVDWLAASELERYHAFKNKRQAERFLANRCFLRDILSVYLGCQPQKIAFAVQPGGKPFIQSPPGKLQFNLTHTGNKALLALSSNLSLGVDLEKIRPIKQKNRIARRVFSREDQKQIEQISMAEQSQLFFALWTLMEARQKTTGTGIFGSKVTDDMVGYLQFSPAADYCAAIAWDNPKVQPEIQFFTYAPASRDGYHT